MYNAAPKFQERQKLYAICVLGKRWIGRTLLCSSSTGRLFAAKLFNMDRYKQFFAKDRLDEEERDLKPSERNSRMNFSCETVWNRRMHSLL
mmetsp:Transcript_597/g.1063  ORF Transcript_597/g.1063 Transcript_597/m.1063 type:complete len:91 (-) Transcript_597:557-829(-)